MYVDGMWLKKSWGGEVKNVSVLIAVGVNAEGYREVLAVSEGSKEDKASWEGFLRGMKERGLGGVKLFVSDECLGFVESLADFYPKAKWQRCLVHWYRHVWTGAEREGWASCGDAQSHPRPGRPDAGGGEAAAHRRYEMGRQTLHGHEAAKKGRSERAGGRNLTNNFCRAAKLKPQNEPKIKTNHPTFLRPKTESAKDSGHYPFR